MPKVFAYVDETGDRGSSASSSPIFGMAAVLVPETATSALRAAVKTLRSDLQVPNDKVLSWKEYAKTHDRRRRAAEVLAAVPDIKVCYVYAKKSELSDDSYRNDKVLFYNYVAFKAYKSVVWASRNMGAIEHRHQAVRRVVRHRRAPEHREVTARSPVVVAEVGR